MCSQFIYSCIKILLLSQKILSLDMHTFRFFFWLGSICLLRRVFCVVCMCTARHAHLCRCVWKPEMEYLLQSLLPLPIYLFVCFRRGLSLDWLTSEPLGSFSLCLSVLGLQTYATTADIWPGSWGSELRFSACSRVIYQQSHLLSPFFFFFFWDDLKNLSKFAVSRPFPETCHESHYQST